MTEPRRRPPADIVADLDLDRWLRPLLWVATAVFLGAFLAFLARGADGPPDPYLLSGSSSASRVAGFEAITVRVVWPDGTVREFCMLLADDEDSRSQGMKGRSDFAGYDGMLFAHGEEVSRLAFTMEGVPIPLTVALFDGAGQFTAHFDMEPCPEGGDCPPYAAPTPFRWAIEAPHDGLPALGIGPGARIEAGASCPAPSG